MVTVSTEQLHEDAVCFFREPVLPESLGWAQDLAPVHLRLFAVELSDALKGAMLTTDLSRLVNLVEDWEATAEVDASPEIQAELEREKNYRPLSEFTT